jgi:hypothetical protein
MGENLCLCRWTYVHFENLYYQFFFFLMAGVCRSLYLFIGFHWLLEIEVEISRRREDEILNLRESSSLTVKYLTAK